VSAGRKRRHSIAKGLGGISGLVLFFSLALLLALVCLVTAPLVCSALRGAAEASPFTSPGPIVLGLLAASLWNPLCLVMAITYSFILAEGPRRHRARWLAASIVALYSPILIAWLLYSVSLLRSPIGAVTGHGALSTAYDILYLLGVFSATLVALYGLRSLVSQRTGLRRLLLPATVVLLSSFTARMIVEYWLGALNAVTLYHCPCGGDCHAAVYKPFSYEPQSLLTIGLGSIIAAASYIAVYSFLALLETGA